MADEYDLHLSRSVRDSLWEGNDGSFVREDDEELAKIIAEEMTAKRPSRRKRKARR